MLHESGVPLCRRYAGSDPMFTPAGFRQYVEDLIVRMVNPYVRDTVARVGRDPARKLGWDDRLVGAMRLAAGSAGAALQPRRTMPLGVAGGAWTGWRRQRMLTARIFAAPLVCRPVALTPPKYKPMLDEIMRAYAFANWSAQGFPPTIETVGIRNEDDELRPSDEADAACGP